MVQQSLEDAVLAALNEGPAHARALATRLNTRGFAGDTSSINSVLYRLEREQRVRRISASPPIWLLVRALARPDSVTPLTQPATKTTEPSEGVTRKAEGSKIRSQPAGADSVSDARQHPSSAGIVWKAAVKHLAKGRALHQNNLVTLIKHDTKLGEPIVVQHLSGGFAGAVRDGLYYDLRPEYRLLLTLKALLPEMTRTSTGNLRTGAFGFHASRGRNRFTGRFEVIDDAVAYWFCIRAIDPEIWAALHATAETTSAGWTLPWRPAPTVAPSLPAPLVWRSAELSKVIAAASEAAAALKMECFDNVTLTVLPPPPRQVPDLTADARTTERLTRRRGTLSAGRKHPIQGSCDHCGQPLSDPYSLLVGVGPVCRQYYSPRVLSAVASATSPITSASSSSFRTPADALARLAKEWA